MFGLTGKNKETEVVVNISNRTVVRVLVLALLAYVLFVGARKASHAFLLLGVAFFLALALNSPVHWLAKYMPGKKRGGRAVATTVSFLVVIVLIAGFLFLITPPIVRNTTNLVKDVPHLVQEAKNKNSPVGKFINKYNLQGKIDTFSNDVSKQLDRIPATAVSAVGKIASSIVNILAILAMTFMMLVEGPYWIRRVESLIPNEHGARARRLGSEMYKVVRGYVNGQVILAAIAAALITPVLFILHISYPLALMVVVFICGLIPLFGHTIGAIIVTLVALFHSPISALIVLGYYILYQQFENYIVQPRIQANTTNLSPLLVFVAVIFGVEFGGLVGGLVAIPVMGCLRVLAVDYLQTRGKLEDINPTGALKED